MKAIGRFASDEAIDAWYRADGEYVVATSEEQIGRWARRRDHRRPARRERALPGRCPRRSVRERCSSPVFRGALLPHGGRHRAAGAPRARPAAGAPRARRADLRGHAGDAVRRRRRRRVAETPGGTVRAGAAVVALNAWAHHWKRLPADRDGARLLHRADGAGARAAEGDRLDRRLGWSPTCGPRSTTCARRPTGGSRSGSAGMQPNLARRIGPRFAYDSTAIRDRVARPPSDVPRVRRGADRGRVGRTDRRLRLPPAVLRHARTRQRALRARLHRQRRGAGAPRRHGSSPTGPRQDRRVLDAAASWTSSRCGSRPSRFARRARSSRTRRSAARTSSRTTATSRTRSSISSRSSPGASATTSVPRPGTVRSRARRAATGSSAPTPPRP